MTVTDIGNSPNSDFDRKLRSIHNPKFQQFMLDNYDKGYKFNQYSTIRGITERGLADAINIWNTQYSDMAIDIASVDKDGDGKIGKEERESKTFKQEFFNPIRDQYDNWGVDCNINYYDLKSHVDSETEHGKYPEVSEYKEYYNRKDSP